MDVDRVILKQLLKHRSVLRLKMLFVILRLKPELEQVTQRGQRLRLADHLCHIVLAHQRLGDHPSPVQPATLEASVVASANEMDATAGAFARIIERERDSGQDWSEWVNTLKRHIHLSPYQRRGV